MVMLYYFEELRLRQSNALTFQNCRSACLHSLHKQKGRKFESLVNRSALFSEVSFSYSKIGQSYCSVTIASDWRACQRMWQVLYGNVVTMCDSTLKTGVENPCIAIYVTIAFCDYIEGDNVESRL